MTRRLLFRGLFLRGLFRGSLIGIRCNSRLRYIFNEKQFTISFREAAALLLKLDRPEIVAKRGYKTFAEHYINAGIKKGKEEGEIKGEIKGIAKGHDDAIKVLQDMGLSEQQIDEAFEGITIPTSFVSQAIRL